MNVQTFVIAFAALVVGLIFSHLVKTYYGWLVIAVLAAIIGTISTSYIVGHTIGLETASDVVAATARKFASSGDRDALIAYRMTEDLPESIVKARVSFWPVVVSFLMMISGYITTFILSSLHVLRIRRAAAIGIKPEDIKIKFDFS